MVIHTWPSYTSSGSTATAQDSAGLPWVCAYVRVKPRYTHHHDTALEGGKLFRDSQRPGIEHVVSKSVLCAKFSRLLCICIRCSIRYRTLTLLGYESAVVHSLRPPTNATKVMYLLHILVLMHPTGTVKGSDDSCDLKGTAVRFCVRHHLSSTNDNSHDGTHVLSDLTP